MPNFSNEFMLQNIGLCFKTWRSIIFQRRLYFRKHYSCPWKSKKNLLKFHKLAKKIHFYYAMVKQKLIIFSATGLNVSLIIRICFAFIAQQKQSGINEGSNFPNQNFPAQVSKVEEYAKLCNFRGKRFSITIHTRLIVLNQRVKAI